MFEAVIDETGAVRDIRTLRKPRFKPPCPEFEGRCRATLSTWKYKPAMHNGKPIAVYLSVAVSPEYF